MSPATRSRSLRILLPAVMLIIGLAALVVAVILIRLGQWPMMIIVLLVALLLISITFYARHEISRRLGRLIRGATSIEMGDYTHRVELHTNDEFEELARKLNEMAESLESSRSVIDEERARTVALAQDTHILFMVSQMLASTLNLEERLHLVAAAIAYICKTDKVAIWLIEDSHLIPYASVGFTPDEAQVFRDWRVHVEETTGLTQQALSERRAVVVEDAQTDERISDDLAKSLDIKSILAIPMVLGVTPIGYLITYETGKTREFTESQKTLAQSVAAQAAVAIQNVKAYERERKIAGVLQRALLPNVPPAIDGFEIADKYATAAQEAEIGGDFYDLFSLAPGRIAMVMADVSGKGLSAGVHTAMVKYMLRAYAIEHMDPAEVIRRLNIGVYNYIGTEAFVTLFYGVLNVPDRELEYVTAGHELPLLFGEDRKICMKLTTTGTALGVVEDYKFDKDKIEFVPGDVLLLYTDGATEVRQNGQFLGVEGLEEIFCDVAVLDAHEIATQVDQRIRAYAQGNLHDDVALMVLKYRRRPSMIERAVSRLEEAQTRTET